MALSSILSFRWERTGVQGVQHEDKKLLNFFEKKKTKEVVTIIVKMMKN